MPEAQPLAPSQPAAPPPVAPPAAPAEGVTQPPAQTIAETATATPTGDEPKPTTPDPAEKRGTSRFERRISRLHREAAEARAERDLLKRQMEELKPKEAPDPGAPKLENFKDIEEYATAKAKHESDKTLKAHTDAQRAEVSKQAQAKLAEDWEEKASRAEDKYPDFGEVVGDLKPTMPWSHALMAAENGDEIAYHLGTHLKEAQEIAALPPVMQILRIGALSAKLAAEPLKPKTPSKAPAPITPLTGAATVATDVPSEQDDMRTWIRKRNKQLGRK